MREVVRHTDLVADHQQLQRSTLLPVLVTALSIEDGETPPPEVGAIGEFPLSFQELPADASDPSIVTSRAVAEPQFAGKPVLQRPGGGEEWWEWTVLLRGTGWTATWYARRPVLGEVEVTGRLVGTLAYAATGRIRGRVTHVRVVSDLYRRDPEIAYSTWKPVPGTRQYREVVTSPKVFASAIRTVGRKSAFEGAHEVGVLVDLDLVDVPPPLLRPSLIPATVSAHGSELWVADRELPLVVHLDPSRRVTEYTVPGQIFSNPQTLRTRTVWAHAKGCWVAGQDGIYHCILDGSIDKVSDTAIRESAVHEEALLAVAVPNRGAVELIFVRPGQEPVIHSADDWGDLESMSAVDDGFLLLFRQRDPNTGELGTTRLVGVDLDGTPSVGPGLDVKVASYQPFLIGAPPTIFDGTTAYRVLGDLTVVDAKPLPGRVLEGGQIGSIIWVVGHPPRGSEHGGWWPLPGPSNYTADHQYWLFTRLDGVTLEPISSTPIRGPASDVTVDGEGVVWVTAMGLHAIPDQTMTSPQPLDVADVVDRSRGPEKPILADGRRHRDCTATTPVNLSNERDQPDN